MYNSLFSLFSAPGAGQEDIPRPADLAKPVWKSNTMLPHITAPPDHPGYFSEEELVSPVEDEDLSNDCTDDSDSTFSDISSLSSIEAIDNGNLIRAQSIKIVSVGKPKVVQVPASPTFPHAGQFDQAFLAGLKRPELPRPSEARHFALTTSLNSIHDSIFEGVEELAELAVPATPVIVRNHVRRPSLPAPVTTTRPKSGHFPTLSDPFPKKAPSLEVTSSSSTTSSTDSIKDDGSSTSRSSVESETSTPSTPTTSSSISRTSSRKFNAAPLMRSIGKSFKPRTPRKSRSIENLRRPTRTQTPPPPLPSQTPSARPKMRARGADEREPVLKLPPCPNGYEAEIEFPDPFLQKELGTAPLPRRAATTHSVRQWERTSLAA